MSHPRGRSLQCRTRSSKRWRATSMTASLGIQDLTVIQSPLADMYSVSSSQWGQYKGTLMGVSHLDLINWTNRLKWFFWELTGSKRKYVLRDSGHRLRADFVQLQRHSVLLGHCWYVLEIFTTQPRRLVDDLITLHVLTALLHRHVGKGRSLKNRCYPTKSKQRACRLLL